MHHRGRHAGSAAPVWETGSIDAACSALRKNIIESLREIVLGDHSLLHRHCPALPEVTLRELLVNAYVHRCWRTNGPIMMTITDESLEIKNPGDLLPGLHVDSLIYCTPVYRNLLLAEGIRFAG